MAIWSDVLQLERVGVRSNFFELGGHSLLAMRVIAQARDVLSVEPPVRTLFEAPTIRELSAEIHAFRLVDALQPGGAAARNGRALRPTCRMKRSKCLKRRVASAHETTILPEVQGAVANRHRAFALFSVGHSGPDFGSFAIDTRIQHG